MLSVSLVDDCCAAIGDVLPEDDALRSLGISNCGLATIVSLVAAGEVVSVGVDDDDDDGLALMSFSVGVTAAMEVEEEVALAADLC